MATNFDNNALSSSGGFKPSTKDTPIDIRSRVVTETDILEIPNPYVGMIIYVQDTGKRFEVLSIKDVQSGLSKVSRVDEYKEFMVGGSQEVDLGPYATIEYVDGEIDNLNIPEKLSDLNNDMKYATETFVNNAIANAQLGGESGEVNLSELVAKNEIGNASQILFNDGQSFQNKLDNGSLQGPKGDTGEQGIQGPAGQDGVDGKDFTYDMFTPEQLEALRGPKGDTGEQGEKGDTGADGLTTSILVNGQTFTHENGIITLPDYPQAGASVDTYSREEIDNIVEDYTGGKKQIYLTQNEYDLLSNDDKNDLRKVYNITDAADSVIPVDLTISSSNLLQLKDADGNTIGTGVTVNTSTGGSEYTLPKASSTVLGGIKVGDRLSIDSNGVLSADIQQGTISDELILISPSGYQFKLVVSDEGQLSTEAILTYGNILASASELSINEGESATFTISLSKTPTKAQNISIVSDNTDVTVNPSSINISDTNPHTITVSVAEDGDYDDETATLTLSSANVSNVAINISIKDSDVEPDIPTQANYVDDDSLVFDLNFKNLDSSVTSEIIDSKQGIAFSIPNNNAGERNTPQGLLLNGRLNGSTKSTNANALATLLDANTDGVTFEYFGNYYPATICQIYNQGFVINNGSGGGYGTGIGSKSSYYNSTDELKSYGTGNSSIVIDPTTNNKYNLQTAAGKEATNINKYTHVIFEMYQDGTNKMFINGFELERTSADVVTDFKEINFVKQFSSSYYFHIGTGDYGADTSYYMSSLRMYNRLLTVEEKVNNRNYELNACGLN